MPYFPQKSQTESFCESPRHVRGLRSQWGAEWCGVDTSDVDYTWKLHVLEDPTPPPGYGGDAYIKDYYDYFPAKTSGFDFGSAIGLANSQTRPATPYLIEHYNVPGFDAPVTVPSSLRLMWNQDTETSYDPGSPTTVSVPSLPQWSGAYPAESATQSEIVSPQLNEYAWPFSLYGHNPAYGFGADWRPLGYDGFRQASVKFAQRTWVRFNKRVRGIWIDADWYASPNSFTSLSSQISGWSFYDTNYSWVLGGGRYWTYFAFAESFFPKNFRFIDYAIIPSDTWTEIPIPEVLAPGNLSDGYLGRITYLVIGETRGVWSGRTGISL